ncbi:energy transducer TonB [Limibacter armeniacum]|uniref:energy transducer TonB n=1 Tax=Limibacter armeniacum TaxID=466084 RepID=UPI002FE62A44
MIHVLHTLGIWGTVIAFFALVIGLIFLFKFIITKSGSDILNQKKEARDASNVLVKKYNDVDVSKYSSMFGLIGLSLSLLVMLVAFEYPSFDETKLVDLGTVDLTEEEVLEVPPTEQKPPPPPQVKTPTIVTVPDEEKIEDQMEIDFMEEFDEEMVVEELPEETAVEEVVEDEIFEIVEENASPKGGMGTFLKWVGKNIRYPSQAKRMGVEGKVYVQFVVDKDGTLTDIKVVRGIGAGCDEEAVRVLQKAPKWTPGRQRGRPVKQRMVLPISFKLG